MTVPAALWHAIQDTITLIWGYLTGHPLLFWFAAVTVVALVILLLIADLRTTPPQQNKGDDPR